MGPKPILSTPPRRSTREIKPAFDTDDWVVKKPVKKKRTSEPLKIVEKDENNNEIVPFSAETTGQPAGESPAKKALETPPNCEPQSVDESIPTTSKSVPRTSESIQTTASLFSSEPPTASSESPTDNDRPKQIPTRLLDKASDPNVNDLKPASPLLKNPSTSKYVRRGRKPKVITASPAAEESEGEYTCSRCSEMFQRKAVAERHVLTEHYGLARLNDTNNEFDEREVLAAYKAAIRVVKTLKCSLCNKSFCSALGLKCHHDVCGVRDEELRRKCEVCGNMLKFRSLKSHMEIHKRETLQRELESRPPGEAGSYDPDEIRPIRKSAKKANEFLKYNAEYDDSDLEYGGSRKRKRRDSNVDFCLTDSDDDSDSTASSSSAASVEAFSWFKSSLALFKLNISTERSFLLYKLWKEHVRAPEAIVERIAGYDECTGYKCDLCEQMFANYELLAFHYSKCDNTLDANWSCRLCNFKAETDLVSLLRHLIERHMGELAEMPNAMYESLMPRPEFKRLRSSSSALPHVIETENFHKNHFGEPTFEEWKFDDRSISFLLSQCDQERYLPERKSSGKFKFKLVKGKKNGNEKGQEELADSEWRQLRLFESVESSTKQHTTIYTGGPVYSGAWCPYPSRTNARHDQVLCLATSVRNQIFNVYETSQHPGVLQFWNFGELPYNQVERQYNKPELKCQSELRYTNQNEPSVAF